MNYQKSFIYSPLGIVKQISGIAGRTSGIGDNVVDMICHITVSTNDCKGMRDLLHSFWIIGAVKSEGDIDRPLCRMVGKK